MLAIEKLRQTASARLFDAKALFAAKRYDGTYYLCGFAVELARYKPPGTKGKLGATMMLDAATLLLRAL